MAVPKKKTSKSRSRSRRAANNTHAGVNLTVCSKCKEPVLPHIACKACGTYKGREVLQPKG